MGVEGVNFSQVEEFLQGFVDEDEADERCESLLCEAGDVADQRACVCGHQDQTQQGCPQADASPQRQVGQSVVPGVTNSFIHSLFFLIFILFYSLNYNKTMKH